MFKVISLMALLGILIVGAGIYVALRPTAAPSSPMQAISLPAAGTTAGSSLSAT